MYASPYIALFDSVGSFVSSFTRQYTPITCDQHATKRDSATDIHLFNAIKQIGDRKSYAVAKRCIDAAMHRTVAFDGMPDRLVVTNIHDTAYA